MSRLVLSSYDGREFTLNVMQFRSPMSAAINSVQTHTMLQHFPIRCGQPDIQFTVQFAHKEEKTIFQAFVRDHQVLARDQGSEDRAVKLFWPERNITNWTGYISSFQVAERRFDNSPVVTFGVDLIESMMSVRTTVSSTGAGWTSYLGDQIGRYFSTVGEVVDGMINPPTPPASTLADPITGSVSTSGSVQL